MSYSPNPSSLYRLVTTVTTAVCLVSCFSEDNEGCDEGFRFDIKTSGCLKIDVDASPDTGPEGEWLGSACSCEGEQCALAGVPTVFRGTIVGCDDVPKEWPGAELGCIRSYVGDFSRNVYFAGGFCTLYANGCRSGDEILCSGAKIGDFRAMNSCPENSVMLTYEYDEEIQGLTGSITTKACSPTCERDSDCRVDAFDEKLNEPGQYQCIDKDGVKFCFDPRTLNPSTLTDDYLAEAF